MVVLLRTWVDSSSSDGACSDDALVASPMRESCQMGRKSHKSPVCNYLQDRIRFLPPRRIPTARSEGALVSRRCSLGRRDAISPHADVRTRGWTYGRPTTRGRRSAVESSSRRTKISAREADRRPRRGRSTSSGARDRTRATAPRRTPRFRARRVLRARAASRRRGRGVAARPRPGSPSRRRGRICRRGAP